MLLFETKIQNDKVVEIILIITCELAEYTKRNVTW